jgi:hypothetical protein
MAASLVVDAAEVAIRRQTLEAGRRAVAQLGGLSFDVRQRIVKALCQSMLAGNL